MIYHSKLCSEFIAVIVLSLLVLFSHNVYGQVSNSTLLFHTSNGTITIQLNSTSPTLEPNSTSSLIQPENLNQSSTESYDDTVVGPNIIHRVWHNMSPPQVHSDMTNDQKIGMNLIRANQLDEEILSLPANNFTTTMSYNQSQAILHQNMTDIIATISNDQEHIAVDKLVKLREKMDGFLGGNPADDIVIDANAQKRTVLQVDGLIHVLSLDIQPSDSIHKDVSTHNILPDQKLSVSEDQPLLYAETGLVATAVVLGGIIGYRTITGKTTV